MRDTLMDGKVNIVTDRANFDNMSHFNAIRDNFANFRNICEE